MSKLEEMIRELCPDGVEYKKIGSIANVLRGKRLTKNQLADENKYPVYHGGLEPLGFYCEKNRDANTAMVINVGASAGTVGFCDKDFWSSDGCFCISHNDVTVPKFVYLALSCQEKYIVSRVRHAGIPTLDAKVIEELSIPVPPLEVQREIVRILDKFTTLTAELTARQKQYSYYREKLLTCDMHIENVPLSELARFTYGYTEKAQETGNARFIRITDINDDGCLNPNDAKYITLNEESKRYLLKRGDLLLARTGATYGKTLYMPNDNPAVYASFLIKIDLDNRRILKRYYWHFSKSQQYWQQAEKYVSKGGQQQFNTNAVGRVVVPVPSLEIQQRIVNILDRFDAICNDLSSGIPAEIEARKKQYEYYRDKLLSFKPLA